MRAFSSQCSTFQNYDNRHASQNKTQRADKEEKKKTEDLAHSLTQLRMQYESKDHSLTELQELYEEEKKNIKIKIKMTKDQTQAHSLNEVRKICEEVMKKEKEEVYEEKEELNEEK